MRKVLVIGSLNIDQTIYVDVLPQVGQTVYGNNIAYACGGKGANQAVTVAKMGIRTHMIGKVGNDEYGTMLLNSLQKYGVIVDKVAICQSATGLASIYVQKNGGNMIVLIKGTNDDFKVSEIQELEIFIKSFDAVLCQNEIPIEITYEAFKLAKKHHVTTIWNPAPAPIRLYKDIINYTDYLIPNETEFKIIFNTDIDITNTANKDLLIDKIRVPKTCKLIITHGAKGVYLWTQHEFIHFPAQKTKAVDTTAAGDAFIGGFTYQLLVSHDVNLAIEFGILVGTLTVLKKGAQDAIPTYQEVKDAFNL